MDNLEKVEKLRERADVSYEEARRALEENNWDLLDAMVYLERQGKTSGPKQSQYSTSYEQQEEYVPVKETVYEKDNEKNRTTFGDVVRKIFRICRDNSFCVRRHEEVIFKIPVLLLVVLLIWLWKILIPLMIVGLFFSFRYSFEGKDDLKEANDIMDNASHAVERMKEGFQRGVKEREDKNSENSGNK